MTNITTNVQICKCTNDEFKINHSKPLSNNATNHINNLQPLSTSCHTKNVHMKEKIVKKKIETESFYNYEFEKIMQDPLSFSYELIESIDNNLSKN